MTNSETRILMCSLWGLWCWQPKSTRSAGKESKLSRYWWAVVQPWVSNMQNYLPVQDLCICIGSVEIYKPWTPACGWCFLRQETWALGWVSKFLQDVVGMDEKATFKLSNFTRDSITLYFQIHDSTFLGWFYLKKSSPQSSQELWECVSNSSSGWW